MPSAGPVQLEAGKHCHEHALLHDDQLLCRAMGRVDGRHDRFHGPRARHVILYRWLSPAEPLHGWAGGKNARLRAHRHDRPWPWLLRRKYWLVPATPHREARPPRTLMHGLHHLHLPTPRTHLSCCLIFIHGWDVKSASFGWATSLRVR